MSDLFESPKLLIGNAQRHISNLEVQFNAWIESKPYARVTEVDSDGFTQIHKIKLLKSMPSDVSTTAFDAINNLRAALDQTGYAAAVASGKTAPRNTAFPFGKTQEDVENALKGRSGDVPCDIRTLFASFKPWQEGNQLLWALNALCNVNKHALLIPIGSATSKVNFPQGFAIRAPEKGAVSFNLPVWTPSTWDRTNNEMVIARADAGATFEADFELTFFLAFGKVPIVEGKPTMAVLSHLTGVVKGIHSATEVACRKLGLVA